MIPKVRPNIPSNFADFSGRSGGFAYSYLELPEDIDTDIEGYS